MKKLKHLLVLLGLMAFGLLSNPLNAQISEGGLPPSFSYPEMAEETTLQALSLAISIDVQKLKAEDLEREALNLPLRTSIILPSNLSAENSGEWITLPDGTEIWRLSVTAKNAIALMLYYDEFYIPEGGKLFIYNKERNHVIGAFTHKSNPDNKSFATEFVAGDEIILEYVVPAFLVTDGGKANFEKPRIKISGIGYGYNYLEVYRRKMSENELQIGESEWCMININCPEGDNWQDQKRGVARSITPILGAGYLCSGTIVNNTANDLTPYFLTASHCFYNNDGNKPLTTEWDQIVYYFNYESPACSPTDNPVNQKTMVGAQLIVELPIHHGGLGSDGALLKLNQTIPFDYNVFYNGWDRRDVAPSSGVGIHHPAGDLKKISTFITTPASTTWSNAIGKGATNGHWTLDWANTVSGKSLTEGGSSGSPIFNQDGRVFGSLTGGPTQQGVPKCDQPVSFHKAIYGKFWYHWDNTNIIDPGTTMATYLDPINTGEEFIDGIYSTPDPIPIIVAYPSSIYVFQTIQFIDESVRAISWDWTFEGGEPGTFNGKKPPLVTYNHPGTFNATLVINKGTAAEKTSTVQVEVKEKGDSPVAPVANFTLDKYGAEVMAEGFDAVTLPPTGWDLEKPGASTSQFIRANMNSAALNFKSIDPNSVYSALVQHDAANEVDTWLKSPEYTVPTNGFLEFWGLWDGEQIVGGVLSVHISTDAGATWTEIWTNGPNNDPTSPGLGWHNQFIMLKDYEGQNVKLGFRYKGQGGYFAGFDGVKMGAVQDPTQNATIGVGEFIAPFDLSAGPPILYEWSFPGGTPESSDQENPGNIQYLTAGLYDITLKVKNYRGEDTRTFTGAVNVVVQNPEVGFNAEIEGGYRLTTYGPFAPKQAYVNFSDNSLKHPIEWDWTFDGATPSSSTQKDPGMVHYNTEGTFDFRLEASNSAGSGDITITDFAKIGYTTGKIWNMLPGEDGKGEYKSDYGHLTGSNNNISSGFGERFDKPAEPGFFQSVDIAFKVNSATSGDLTVGVMGVNPSTGNPLGKRVNVTLPVTDINTNGPTTITFPERMYVDDTYFITVEGFRKISTYDILIQSSPVRLGESALNTAYQFTWINFIFWLPIGWYPMSDTYENTGVSLNIIPEFTYALLEVEGDTKFIKKNIDPAANTINVKSNDRWDATPLNPWIEVQNGSGHDGNGSFTFTVQDNTGNARKGIIRVACGAGVERYITVLQAGANPTELVATVNNENEHEVNLTWQRPDVNASESIFENVENHTAFALNSPGETGWMYIDGDGAATAGIGTAAYPNKNQPMAFQVFNVPQSGETDPSLIVRSGKQIFACFAATGVANDDWIISPELEFGENFTFSFWAKSFFDNTYTEVIDVVYSTTGYAKADFTNVVATENINSHLSWNQYKYTIPANAKYVAINCKSNNQFVLMLDDIFIGIGAEPESAYKADPTLNANPFEGELITKTNRINEAESQFTPEQLAAIEQLKTGKVDISEPITITNQATGEVITTTLKAPNFDNQLKLASKTSINQTLASEEYSLTEEATLPLTRIGYSDGVPIDNSIGLSSGGDLEVAIRFTPIEIISLHNTKIKAVDLYLYSLPKDGITLNIRSGNEIVHSQKVTNLTTGKFMRISLNKEVRIDASKDLYIGYAYTQNPSMYVPGVDGGAAVIGMGDLIAIGGEPFESIGEMGLSYNWLLYALVENSKGMVELGYNVYRDGELIAEDVSEELYNDLTAAQANVCYEVTAVYNKELESTPSNMACAQLKNLLEVTAIDATRYVNEPNPEFIVSITGDFTDGDTEEDLKSLFEIACVADEDAEIGEYPITIKPVTHDKYRFAYKEGKLTVTVSTSLNEAPVLTAAVENDVNVHLEWTAVTGAVNYTVYRDGEEIASVTDLTYEDNALAGGEYCYTIKGVSSLGVESDMSNEACAIVKYELKVGVQNATRYVGEQNPAFVIAYEGFATGDTEDMLAAKPTATCDATMLSAAGTYDIIVSGGESDWYRFIYTNGTLTVKNRYEDPNKATSNAFTPYEKDGINDIFLPGAKIEIVNRYGQDIFNGHNGWDGTKKDGQLVNPGTYYYKATLSDGRVLRGSVEVIKKK